MDIDSPLAGGEDRIAPCTADKDLPAGRLFTIPATHSLGPGGASIFVAGPKLKAWLLSERGGPVSRRARGPHDRKIVRRASE